MVENQNIEEIAPETQSSSKSQSPHLLKFLKEFEQKESPEEKIQALLDYMRQSLAQDQGPSMREFWEARKFCLPIFKQSLSAKSRGKFWEEYMELTKEARRLKEILETDASFACEQIEIAIQALKTDLEKSSELASQISDIEISESSQTLLSKKTAYNAWHKELQLLGAYASRVNSLRDEIIKTPMRLRFKNRLFEQLMEVGDTVFPRRKELTKQVSEAFALDVESFIEKEFRSSKALPYVLKEEIKALQSFAKQLTLNVSTFATTRQKLSECWDSLREQEKEYKKEMALKKEFYRQNYDLAIQKIQELSDKCAAGNISEKEVNGESGAILDWMKSVELGRDEVRDLKFKLKQAQKPLFDKIQEIEQKQKNLQESAAKEKKDKTVHFLNEVRGLLEKRNQTVDFDLSEKYEHCSNQLKELAFSEGEKMTAKALLRDLQEWICDEKQKSLLSSKGNVLDEIRALLDLRKQMKQELKQELEGWRKVVGGSGLDFGKSMFLNELIESGKSHLDTIDNAIIELEERIFDLRNYSKTPN